MRLSRRLACTGLALALVRCGGDEPPPPPPPPPPAAPPPPPAPTVVSLTLKAKADLNPDAAGNPKPVRVRVLELASGNAFAEADFFALDQGLQDVLGADLLGTKELVLAPGATEIWQAKLQDGTRVIGVMAAYQALDTAMWRAWKEVPPNATTLLAADLGAGGIALREATP